MNNIIEIKEDKNLYIKKVFDILQHTVWIKEEQLKEKKWKVILRESNSHFDEEIAGNISKALNSSGCKEIYGVQCEDWSKDKLSVYKLNTDIQTLLQFDREIASLFYFALFPEDVSFIIICSITEYLIFAGTESFVEAASGYTVKEAEKKFKAFIEEYHNLPLDQEHFEKVTAYYNKFNNM